MLPRRHVRAFLTLFLGWAVSASWGQTVITWGGATSGAWTTAGNWSPATVPNNLTTHDAVISPIGAAYTVTAGGAASLSVHKLDVTSANATVLFDFASTYSLTLGTATSAISAGTVEFRTSHGLFGNGSANTILNVASGAQLAFTTNGSTRNLSSLTLNNSGTLLASSGILAIGSTVLNNPAGGLVHANNAEITLHSGTTLANSGTLRATGASGLLRFNGTYTTVTLGTVDLVSGGRAILGGTINNLSSVLNAPTGGSYELLGGSVNNGTIAAGALKFTSSGGTLNGASLAGNLDLTGSSVRVDFTGGAGFTGANATLGNSGGVYWKQVGSLTGKAITFGSNSYLYVSGANNALTLGAGTTATGDVSVYTDGSAGASVTNAGTITHDSGSGTFNGPTATNSGGITANAGSFVIGSTTSSYTTGNSGSITASGTNNSTFSTVYLDGNVTNTGTVVAQNFGRIYQRGTNTTGHLGNVTVGANGHYYFNGTLDNTAATLSAPTGGGVYELLGGTIQNGTINASALTFTSSAGTLTGVSLVGDLTVPVSTRVDFAGGTTFTGTNATLGANSGLYWKQAGTLSGKALTFGANSYLYVSGAGSTLTLGAGTTATGEIAIYTDGASGTAITNAGTISHTSSGSGYLYGPSVTNSNAISANVGSLQIGSTSSGYNTANAGTITAGGTNSTSYGTIYLDGNVTNTGTIVAQNFGRIYQRGTNTTGHLGNVTVGANGHFYFNGTLDNSSATLGAPAGGGVYELYGGTSQGGTVNAGALTFTNGAGTLSGVTLTGDLTVPASTRVDLAGGSTFTGTNATLGANSGLYWKQAGTLSGKALTFGANSYLYVSGAGSTLTLGAGTTATGEIQAYTDGNAGTAITNAGTITHTGGNGYLYGNSVTNSGAITAGLGSFQIGSTSSGYNTTNSGSITVDGTNSTTYGTIYLDGNVTNTGTLVAQNFGRFFLRGTNTTAHLGNITVGTNGHFFLNGTLDNSAATLGAPTGGGVYELYGGTIQNGTVNASALAFTSAAGTLSGVTLNGNLTLPAATRVDLAGGTTFSGATASLGANAGLYWEQAGTLTGKALTFGTNSYVYVSGANHTLTLGAGTTATGEVQIYTDGSAGTAITNAGTITHTTGAGYLYGTSVTNTNNITATAGSLQIGSTSSSYNTSNSGTITADGTNSTTYSTVYLDGNVTNTGSLVAQNFGRFYLRGTNTTAHLGSITVGANGHVYLNGTLDNTAATLSAPTGGAYELYGGTIQHGTINANALTFTNGGGTLSGVAVNGDLVMPASSHVDLAAGTTISGPNLTLGSNVAMYWSQSGTLTGKTLTFGPNSYVYVNGANRTLTLGAGTTTTGEVAIYTDGSAGTVITNAGTLTHNAGNGFIYGKSVVNSGTMSATAGSFQFGTTSSGYSASNSGTIVADGASTSVYVEGFTNTGTFRAQNSGKLFLQGSNTTASLGTLQIASGGHIYLNNTIDNTSATLPAPSGGPAELFGGTITGGSIATAALSFTTSGGLLDGVALLDPLISLPTNSYVTFTGGTTFATGATLGANAFIYWNQAGTLSGKALTFGSNSRLYLNAANASLTLGNTTTATGTLGIHSDSFSANTSITNQAALTNTSGTGQLYAKSFANAGAITATGGTLNLGTTLAGFGFANTGSITVNGAGAAVQLFAHAGNPIINQGTVNVINGTLYTNGNLTNSTGTLAGAGTINGGLTMTGGTLAPGHAGIGTLNFSGGAFAVTGATTFAFELGGANADKLAFQFPSNPINIGSGLVTLSLTLTAAPVNAMTYNLVQITSGTGSISGTFAGLASSGATFTSSFNSTPYLFAVNYSSSLISITAVPEPSTYVLFGVGLAALPFLRRRRR